MKAEIAYWSGLKLPKGAVPIIYFDNKGVWYQIIQNKDKYIIYRKEINGEFTQLAVSNKYIKLEQKVRDGILK